MTRKEWFIQVSIFVLTFFAITLVNIPSLAFLAPFFGFAVQPVWIYQTIKLKQWGMLALSIWFVFSWGFGIFNVLTGVI